MLLNTVYQLPGKILLSASNGSLLQRIPSTIANRVQAGTACRKQLLRCAFLSPACLYHQNRGDGNANRLLGGPPNVPFYKCFSSSLKKEEFQIKSVEGAEILQNVLEKNKQLLQEKKKVIIQDIRDRKDKVKERVEEVIERENVATIPNLLCIGRIVMSPVGVN